MKKTPHGAQTCSREGCSRNKRGKPERYTSLRAVWLQEGGKLQRKPLSELYVDGKFTEDRDDWQKETAEEDGRRAEITVDVVLQARAKMSENKVNGPEDAVVSEMIKQLPWEKIADPMVGYWCRVGSLALTHTRTDIFGAVAGEGRAPAAGTSHVPPGEDQAAAADPCVGSLCVLMFEAAHVPASTFGVAGSLALTQQLSASPPVEFSIFIGGTLDASGSSECKPGFFQVQNQMTTDTSDLDGGPSCQCYKTSFVQNRELEQCSV